MGLHGNFIIFRFYNARISPTHWFPKKNIKILDPTFRAGPLHRLWMPGSTSGLPPHLLGKASCAAAPARMRRSRHPNRLRQTPGRTGWLCSMLAMGWPVCLKKNTMCSELLVPIGSFLRELQKAAFQLVCMSLEALTLVG